MRRSVGWVARRIDRPQLFGALYPAARRGEDDAVAMRAIISAVLREDSCYVDVGANRGQVLADALRVAPRGRHVAFEPIPALASELGRRFPGVDARAMALGASSGSASFCHYTRLDGWSGLRPNPQIDAEHGAPVMIEVQVSTLDEQLEGLQPALVKIDVEGAELAVLEGGRALLARVRPTLLIEHVGTAALLYGADSGSLWDLLEGSGYRVFAASGEGPFEREAFLAPSDFVNWIAAPRA